MASALLLIAHGSPNSNWREPLERVREQARLLAPHRRIELCYLERCEPDIASAVAAVHADGVRSIQVVALLLSGGGRHMIQDIPDALTALRERFPDLDIRLAPAPAGAHPGVIEALARAVLEP